MNEIRENTAEKAAPLPLRKTRLLELLLAGRTLSAAARELKISRSTAALWRQDPAFRAALDDGQADRFGEAMRGLNNASVGAVRELAKIIETSKDPGLRRLAARDILGFCFKVREDQDFEARLKRLEDMFQELLAGGGGRGMAS